jgi:membrane protein DedA with SNARE-associated domain
VFFGRFVVGLRTWASWLAGATRMDWRVFAAWNALGGICWSVLIGLLAYYAGKGVETVIKDVGLYALVVLALVGVAVVIAHRRGHLRRGTDGSVHQLDE